MNVHDLDGAAAEAAGEWSVEGSVARVSVCTYHRSPSPQLALTALRTDNSKNLTLRLPSRIVTSTVEMFNCADLSLLVGPPTSAAPAEETAPLAVLQLDPSLHNVKIHYTSAAATGKIVLAPHLSTKENGQPSFGFTSVSLQVGDGEPFILFDDAGNFRHPSSPSTLISPSNPPPDLASQLVLSFSEGSWSLSGLQRNEKDYPVLS